MDLSYADDTSYEEQVPDATEQEASTSLKERIGNRIYLLEDSRKRKLLDTEETAQDDDEDAEDTHDADLTHRSNALLLRGPPISQLPTARVFAYATHFDAHPIGLEWVDDQTCVLVFTSRKHALQAWDALRRPSHAGDLTTDMQPENDETVFSAPPLPLALYPIEDRINSVLGTQKSAALKETINIRWARSSDVKQPGSRVRSEFYKKHGEMAGKESLPGIPQHKRRRYNEGESDTRHKLDAELDSFLGVGDEQVSTGLIGRTEESRDEDARRQLDEELDSFLAQGGEVKESDEKARKTVEDRDGRSLMDRTTRPLPRRGRRRRDARQPRAEGEDGRWLHNAEMTGGPRSMSIDMGGTGMRAWGAEEVRRPVPNGGRTRRPHKTQEELDRELEEFLGA